MLLGDLLVRVVGDTTPLEKDVADVGNSPKIAATGTKAGKLFTTALVAGGAAGAAVFTGAIGGAVQFEDQLRTINTVAHLTDDQLKGVGNSILDLSKETGKTTDDLTAGFYDLVSAGIPADKAINVLRDSAKFATGALGTTAEAVDLVSSALNAYGLQADQSTKVTDIFAQAVADGKVTASQLGSSIAQIAPIAASAGISLEEVSAGFAVMTAKGSQAGEVATNMRQAIAALLTPNEQLNAIQKQTGINFAELAKSKGLAVALETLRKATNGNNDAFARSLGSVQAYQFALASTGDNANAFAAELGKVEDAATKGGVAQGQYDERMKSAEQQGNRMLASIHALGLEIGGPFVQLLGPAVSVVGQLGQGIHGLFLLSSAVGGLLGKLVAGAWGKIGSLSIVQSAIGKAGSLAATAYLKALILGDSIASAVSGAWGAIVNSSLVQGAISKAGAFMGSGLGAAAAVALAAVLIVKAVQTYNEIKDQLGQQGADIGKHVGEEIATGSVESLEASKGALEKGIADLAEVHDFGIFTNDARANLQHQLGVVTAELKERATHDFRDAGQSAAAAFVKPLSVNGPFGSDLATSVNKVVTLATKGAFGSDLAAKSSYAKAYGYRLAGATADGIKSGRDLADAAWQALVDAIKNVEQPSVRAARLLGRLSSKALAGGLNDARPEVRARAEQVFQSTIDELTPLIAAGTKIGKTGMQALRDAMHSKNATVRAAAHTLYLEATGSLTKIPAQGTKAGRDTAANVATQLTRGSGAVGTAAANLGATIASRVLKSILAGAAPLARTGGAPVAYDVGTNYVPFDQLALVHRGEIILPARQSAEIRSGSATLVGPGGGAHPVASQAGGPVVNNFNLTVAGLVQARDPMEIAREMRRVASFKPAIDRARPLGLLTNGGTG